MSRSFVIRDPDPCDNQCIRDSNYSCVDNAYTWKNCNVTDSRSADCLITCNLAWRNNLDAIPFVLCCIAREGSSTLVNDWFGCLISNDQITLPNFCDEFTAGSFDNEPLGEKERRMFAEVFAGSSKKGETLTQPSPAATVADILVVLGSFFKFVLSTKEKEQPSPSKPKENAHNDIFDVKYQKFAARKCFFFHINWRINFVWNGIDAEK